MSAPPPVPSRKPGFFHTVKTTVSSVGNREKKTVVGQFEEKRTEFRTLLEDLNRLDSELRTLYDKFSQISQSTVGVWDPLVKQYSSASHHPGGVMATSARSCASNFNEVGMPPARAYLDSAKETVHNLLKECTDLNQEIKTRDNSLSEFDYYSDKYLDLLADRDKTLAKGKSIKPADQEKIDRNLEKRNSSERDYLDRHTIIDTKLVRFLESRYDNLESVCKNIVEAQHLFATNITGMINDITEKIVKETNIINSIVSPLAINNSNAEVADSNPFARSSQPDATPSAPPVYNPESTPVSNTYYEDSQNSDSTRDYSRPPPMAPRY